MNLIDSFLLPDWETTGMYLLAKTWQEFMLDEIATEINLSQDAEKTAATVFQERYSWFPSNLSRNLAPATLHLITQAIRETILRMDQGALRWIMLTALVARCSEYAFTVRTPQEVERFISSVQNGILLTQE